ncbi:MAG: glutamate synthase, partial [Deltaproteobacteria bacterium]|nr:glutamate synthase [Deltaproteobacteria bacterium]
MKTSFADKILQARGSLYTNPPPLQYKDAEEGGCGVTGFACSVPVGGKHIFEPSRLMHNRGNGKGGGIAAAGLVAEDLSVSQEVLDEYYLVQVALLDPSVREAMEEQFIAPHMNIALDHRIPTVDDYREVEGLEIRPPDVWRYFVRVKPDILSSFAKKNKLEEMDARKVEDEFIWQNTIRLN